MRCAGRRFLICGSALAMPLLASFGGCALRHGEEQGPSTAGRSLSFYGMYDNSRDWGPSYLVGPPDRHFGDGTRIDDNRSHAMARSGGDGD
jgi:hypothetical protein